MDELYDDRTDISEAWEEWLEEIKDTPRMQVINARLNNVVDDWSDQEAIMQAFEMITLKMMLQDTLDDLEAKDLIERCGIDDNGEILYQAVGANNAGND